MTRTTRDVLGFSAAALIALVVNHRVVLGLAHYTFDYDGYHFPIASALYEGFPALVTWDRYSYGGIALSSNLQAAALHPPQLLVFAVEKLAGHAQLSEYAFGWVGILNFIVLAVGAYALGRWLSRSVSAGVLSAALVSASGAVLAQSQHMGVVGTLAPVPFIVLALLSLGPGLSRSARVLRIGGVTAGLAYSLSAGFIPQFLGVVLVLGVVLLAIVIVERRAALIRIVGFAIGGVIALLLNAGALASFLLTPGQTLQLRSKPPVTTEQLLTFVVPDAFDIRSWPETTWAVDPTTHYTWGGVAFLIMICAALATRPPRREVLLIAVPIGIVLLATTPLVAAAGELLEAIRPFNLLAPSVILVATASAATAWARRDRLRGRAGVAVIAVAVLSVAGLATLSVVAPAVAGFDVPEFVVFALATTVVVVLLVAAPFPRVAGAALVLLVVAEGAMVAGARFIQAPNPPIVSLAPFEDDELLAILEARPGRVAADGEFMGGRWNGWWSVWRIPSVDGFQPTFPERWDEAAEAASTWRDDRRFSYDRFDTGRPQELGITTFVTADARAATLLGELDGSRVLWQKYGFTVLTIPDAEPAEAVETSTGRVPLELSWESDAVATARIGCDIDAESVSIVGVLDHRWSASLDGRDLGPGIADGGRTEWPLDGCGDLRLTFVDRPYLAGMAATGVALVLGTLLVVGAAVVSRRGRRLTAATREPTAAAPATAPIAS